jgi:hypothetical protein
MGFLKPELLVVDFDQWRRHRAGRSSRWPGTGPRWVRHPGGAAPLLRGQDPALHPGCLAGGADHWVDGFTAVARWGRSRSSSRRSCCTPCCSRSSASAVASGRSTTATCRPWVHPVLVAAQHHSVTTVAESGALTRGDNREPVDILLYAALLSLLVVALFSDGTGPGPHSAPRSACCRCGRSGRSSGCWRWPACATR